MVPKGLFSAVRNGLIFSAVLFGASLLWAVELSFSASVDKTTIEVGQPIQLTITLSGEAIDGEVATPVLPDGFAVVGQSRSTNFSIQAGAIKRSVGLIYVVVPQRPGSFQLGPFEWHRKKEVMKTAPIQITVTGSEKPKQKLPPGPGARYTI